MKVLQLQIAIVIAILISICAGGSSLAASAEEVDHEPIKEIVKSNYCSVIKDAEGSAEAVVLVPESKIEKELALKLAIETGLNTLLEPALKRPLPAYPVDGISPDTNLILLSAGKGGALTQALRRAGLVIEDQRIPGKGGWSIRTIARPFAASKANVIVISGGGKAGLENGVSQFKLVKTENGQMVYDKFLVMTPGKVWKKVRSSWYDAKAGDEYFDKIRNILGTGDSKGRFSGRVYSQYASQLANRYYATGNDEFARIYKGHILKFSFGNSSDDHMGLHLLVWSWDRIEESPVFNDTNRLKITNFILQSLRGQEGYQNYTVNPNYAYVNPLMARQNHQTINANGLLQGYLYFNRLYDLAEADKWKQWADDTAAKATVWGGIEDSANYQIRAFAEVARHYHLQGLTTKDATGTDIWLQRAKRNILACDGYIMRATFGDCWTTSGVYVPAGVICGNDFLPNTYHDGLISWLKILYEDWDYVSAQWIIDKLILARRKLKADGYLSINRKPDWLPRAAVGVDPTTDEFAYLFGSVDVGGPKTISSPVLSQKQKSELEGLSAFPVTKGYYDFRAGKIPGGSPMYFSGNTAWAPSWMPPYERALDKIIYRSGWGSALVKDIEVDGEGILRFKWWKDNEKLKKKRLPVELVDSKATKSMILLKHNLDLGRTTVIEGQVRLTDGADNADKRGIFIEDLNGTKGYCVMFGNGKAELGRMKADGSEAIMERFIDREIELGSNLQFRVVIKNDVMETYLNDYLMTLSRLESTGKMGFICGSDKDAYENIQVWQAPASTELN